MVVSRGRFLLISFLLFFRLWIAHRIPNFRSARRPEATPESKAAGEGARAARAIAIDTGGTFTNERSEGPAFCSGLQIPRSARDDKIWRSEVEERGVAFAAGC